MLDQLYYPVKNVSNKKKVENHECPVIIRYPAMIFFSPVSGRLLSDTIRYPGKRYPGKRYPAHPYTVVYMVYYKQCIE